jgi:hypothetical protein
MVRGFAVSKNILIVESYNDKFFIEALLSFINVSNVEIDTPVCNIDEYECLSGLSGEKLRNKLVGLTKIIERGEVKNIGILVDADSDGVESKIKLINAALAGADFEVSVLDVNQWFLSQKLEVNVSCHVLNFGGAGELETLLKAIKSQDSTFADCLVSWRECLEKQGKVISQKDFDKFWVSIYQRFDHCSKNDKKQADRKCSTEASMKKPIWNFDHEALAELKAYLRMFT